MTLPDHRLVYTARRGCPQLWRGRVGFMRTRVVT